ncbi:Duplicated homeodomain-like superfamily protein [Raphanus sativus]|nr:Duplicated homeodomain-like superfamily protein [Raphanus sativus]
MGPKQWTRDDDKLFERLLMEFPENRVLADVKHYYEALMGSHFRPNPWRKKKKRGTQVSLGTDELGSFLEGLAKYGKGDWKNISRKSVKTRTPTQVASHEQKYFLRQAAEKKAKQRSSIDICMFTGSGRRVQVLLKTKIRRVLIKGVFVS